MRTSACGPDHSRASPAEAGATSDRAQMTDPPSGERSPRAPAGLLPVHGDTTSSLVAQPQAELDQLLFRLQRIAREHRRLTEIARGAVADEPRRVIGIQKIEHLG